MLVDITGFVKDKSGWWAQTVEESESGLYEDRLDHIDLTETYKMCELCVEDPDCEDEENFLVALVRNDPELVPLPVAEFIATELLGSTLEEAFPGNAAKYLTEWEEVLEEPAKKKQKMSGSKKGSKKAAGPLVLDEVIPHECPVDYDHDDLCNYKSVTSTFYFLEERKFCKAECRGCKLPFETEASAAGSKKQTKKLPLPSARSPAYVCCNFEKDKSACGNFYCSPCHAEKASTAGGSRKRRDRN